MWDLSFNPKAILEYDPCVERLKNDQDDLDKTQDSEGDSNLEESESGSQNTDKNDCTDTLFTDEENQRFSRRFEEGYNLYDLRFVLWLVKNHPESVPIDPHALAIAAKTSTLDTQDSVADFYSHLPAW